VSFWSSSVTCRRIRSFQSISQYGAKPFAYCRDFGMRDPMLGPTLIENQSTQFIQSYRCRIDFSEIDLDASHLSARELLSLVSTNWVPHSDFDQEWLIGQPANDIWPKIIESLFKKHRVKNQFFCLADCLRFNQFNTVVVSGRLFT
jgi:hypothetical protein